MIEKDSWADFKRSEGRKELWEEMSKYQESAMSELVSRMPGNADEKRDFFLRGLIWVTQLYKDFVPEFVEGDQNEAS